MQYSNFIMKNNVHATLSTALSSVATTIQLTTGQGARFGTEFPQIATLESFDDTGKVIKREIVQITARNDDDLTVVRAFAPCPANDDANSQSQSSVSFSADDQISLYIPKEIFDKISKSLNDIYDNGTNNMRTDLVSGLQVEVNPGSVLVGSAYYDFAGGTITLTDNATNYLEIDEDGNLANNTTGRNDENTKLAIITTASGSVTKIQDWRLGTVGGKIGGVNIHELTEKLYSNGNDEILIADSENIFQNKKIKVSNFGGIGNFGAGEQIDKGDVIYQEQMISGSDVNSFIAVGFSNNVQKVSLMRIGNGQDFSSMKLYLAKSGTPTNNLTIRIETDDNGNPSGNLIDGNATATINQSSLTTTPTEKTINFGGTINIPQGTVCHIVLSQGVVDTSNFYQIGGKEMSPNLFKIKQYDGSVWNNYKEYGAFFMLNGCASDGLYTFSTTTMLGKFCLAGNGIDLFVIRQGYALWHYTLSTPRDITTATSGTHTSSVGQSYMKTTMTGNYLFYRRNTNGRHLYRCDYPGYGSVNDYGTFDGLSDFYLSADGTKFFTFSSNTVKEYSVSTAFDLSTATATGKTFSATGGELSFSPDGKNLYIRNRTTITRYSMSTAWDITTATITTDTFTTTANGGQFQIDFTYGYMFVSDNNVLKKYVSTVNYGDNSLIFNNCDGLQELEIGKASASDTSKIPPISMVSKGDFEIGNTVIYDVDVNNKQSGLTIGQKYYLSDTPGEIQTTPGTNEFEVGIAIEPTILKLKQTY